MSITLTNDEVNGNNNITLTNDEVNGNPSLLDKINNFGQGTANAIQAFGDKFGSTIANIPHNFFPSFPGSPLTDTRSMFYNPNSLFYDPHMKQNLYNESQQSPIATTLGNIAAQAIPMTLGSIATGGIGVPTLVGSPLSASLSNYITSNNPYNKNNITNALGTGVIQAGLQATPYLNKVSSLLQPLISHGVGAYAGWQGAPHKDVIPYNPNLTKNQNQDINQPINTYNNLSKIGSSLAGFISGAAPVSHPDLNTETAQFAQAVKPLPKMWQDSDSNITTLPNFSNPVKQNLYAKNNNLTPTNLWDQLGKKGNELNLTVNHQPLIDVANQIISANTTSTGSPNDLSKLIFSSPIGDPYDISRFSPESQAMIQKEINPSNEMNSASDADNKRQVLQDVSPNILNLAKKIANTQAAQGTVADATLNRAAVSDIIGNILNKSSKTKGNDLEAAYALRDAINPELQNTVNPVPELSQLMKQATENEFNKHLYSTLTSGMPLSTSSNNISIDSNKLNNNISDIINNPTNFIRTFSNHPDEFEKLNLLGHMINANESFKPLKKLGININPLQSYIKTTNPDYLKYNSQFGNLSNGSRNLLATNLLNANVSANALINQ